MMALIQLLAASLAKVDRVVYHAHPQYEPIVKAIELFNNDLLPPDVSDISVGKMIEQLVALKLRWGQSDGN